MKQVRLWSVIFTLIFTNSALQADTKRYEVESGIIEYKTNGSGNMMGIKTQMSGTNKVVFKAWGNVELHQGTTKTIVMGREETTQETTKIENGKVLVVDYEQKSIIEYDPSMLMQTPFGDLTKSSQEMLKDMNAKKVGEESIMGYKCEIWEMPQMKVWLHKGLALKSQTEIMGIQNSMEATNVQLDVSVSDKELQLPDFPRKGLQEQMPQMTPEQMQQMQEMMKSFSQR